MRKSRFAAALASVIALAFAAVAMGAGSDENSETVLGKVKPAKLDKNKFKPVSLYAGVETTTTHAVPGQQNPEQQLIEFGKNVKFNTNAAPPVGRH